MFNPNSNLHPFDGGDGTTYLVPLITSSLIILGIALVSHYLFPTANGPAEPTEVFPRIPFIGHTLGVFLHGADYFNILISKTDLPIFTIRACWRKIYIVNSPELADAVFRNSRTISMEQIILDMTKRVFYTPKHRVDMLKKRYPSNNDTVLKQLHRGMHASMSSSHRDSAMNKSAMDHFAKALNDINRRRIAANLYILLICCFTNASAEALYGPVNPVSKDSSMAQKLLNFEAGICLLYADFFPSIIAREAHQARSAISAAFKLYYFDKLHLRASSLINERYRKLRAGGLKTNDMKDWDVGILVAATMSSFSGTFWLICYIFSDAALLAELRAEISEVIDFEVTKDDKGKKHLLIDISVVQQNCPLLVSTWMETLRLRNASIGKRVVNEETVLNGTYLLKKGAMLQMPTRDMHTSTSIWGPTATTFDARRFLAGSNASFTPDEIDLQKKAFTPYGGGSALCPGRHFATLEILGFVSAFVVGYDLKMKDGGALTVPGVREQRLSVTILEPVEGLNVIIQAREGFESVVWEYDTSVGVNADNMAFCC